MGMYDTVIFTCPKCGETLTDQSKAGQCLLREFPCDDVPTEIAVDLNGEEIWCQNQECKASFKIRAFVPMKVSLLLEPKQ